MSYQVLSSYQLLTFSKMINWLPDYLIKVKLVKSQKCSLWSWCWCNFCDDVDIESIINQFDVHEILRLRELLAIAGRHSGEVSHSQLTVLLKGQVLFASAVGSFLNIYHHPYHMHLISYSSYLALIGRFLLDIAQNSKGAKYVII